MMHFSAISSNVINIHVGNSCCPYNKVSKNVIIFKEIIFLEAYNCIKNLFI